MPMIQIEQDRPELIVQVRSQITEMVERTRKHPGTAIGMIAEEFVRGYLAALIDQNLLSVEQWRLLVNETSAAAKG